MMVIGTVLAYRAMDLKKKKRRIVIATLLIIVFSGIVCLAAPWLFWAYGLAQVTYWFSNPDFVIETASQKQVERRPNENGEFEIKDKNGNVIYSGRSSAYNKFVESAVARGVDLSNADMRGVKLLCDDWSTTFTAKGAIALHDLGRTTVTHTGKRNNLRGANLKGADLSYGYFQGCDFSGANFEGANLKFAYLESTLLKNANFKGADLTGANFLAADLEKADLMNARFDKTSLMGANLRGARMSPFYWIGAYAGSDSMDEVSFRLF